MIRNIIEALIFASANGFSYTDIHEKLPEYTKQEKDRAIAELKKKYDGSGGIVLIEFNSKYQFQTNPEYGELLADLLLETREKELSKTLLTVLAIIAYKQPITRQEIEALRGANSDYVVAMLLKQNLIEPQGRKAALGNPILYGTTEEFLKKFGLTELADLPDYEDLLIKIKNNYDKYHAKSQDLYRERDIDEEEKRRAGVAADDFIEEEPLEHLEGEEDVKTIE